MRRAAGCRTVSQPAVIAVIGIQIRPRPAHRPLYPGTRTGARRHERGLAATRSDGTLTRQVALKLPYAHLACRAPAPAVGRERDILAALSHPHVAVLYDAGVSDDGHPYLAMEWDRRHTDQRYCEKCSSPSARD